jgi:drug/metabolite transporter (DMT)-like permease
VTRARAGRTAILVATGAAAAGAWYSLAVEPVVGAWAGLAYGATFGMAVAMALWGASVRALGPTRTMISAYLEPVSAVIIAAALLGESVAPDEVIGALVVFAGVWLAA